MPAHPQLTAVQNGIMIFRRSDLPAQLHGPCSSRTWDRRDVACAVPDNWDRQMSAARAAHHAPGAYRSALSNDDVLDLA